MKTVYKPSVSVSWHPGLTIAGVVLDKPKVETFKSREVRFIEISRGGVPIKIYEVAALKEAFDQVQRGQFIAMRHLGVAQLKGGQTFNRIAVLIAQPDKGETWSHEKEAELIAMLPSLSTSPKDQVTVREPGSDDDLPF